MYREINKTKFSIIGTNPQKYLNNYITYINRFSKGTIFEIDVQNYLILNDEVTIFNCNSPATFRQNIDAWIWMGFIIKNQKNQIIKIIDTKETKELINHIKWNLLINDDKDLVNQHRDTIIKKLLTLNNKFNKSFDIKVSYKKIIDQCGKFEKNLSKDKWYIKMLFELWGDN